MKQTAESLIEPSSSTTCSIALIKDRLMTNSIICKHVLGDEKSQKHRNINYTRMTHSKSPFTNSVRGMKRPCKSLASLSAALRSPCKISAHCRRVTMARASLPLTGVLLRACWMAVLTYRTLISNFAVKITETRRTVLCLIAIIIIIKGTNLYTMITDQHSIKVPQVQSESAMLVHFDSSIGFLEKCKTFFKSLIQRPQLVLSHEHPTS